MDAICEQIDAEIAEGDKLLLSNDLPHALQVRGASCSPFSCLPSLLQLTTFSPSLLPACPPSPLRLTPTNLPSLFPSIMCLLSLLPLNRLLPFLLSPTTWLTSPSNPSPPLPYLPPPFPCAHRPLRARRSLRMALCPPSSLRTSKQSMTRAETRQAAAQLSASSTTLLHPLPVRLETTPPFLATSTMSIWLIVSFTCLFAT